MFGVPFTTDCCHRQRSICLIHLAIFQREYSLRKIVKCIRSITHDDRLHTGQALHCKKSSENFETKYIFLSNFYCQSGKIFSLFDYKNSYFEKTTDFYSTFSHDFSSVLKPCCLIGLDNLFYIPSV